MRVFVDANVLCSRKLRDWLFLTRLAAGMYTLHATRDVIVETLRATRHRNAKAPGKFITDLEAKLYASLDEVFDDFPSSESLPGIDINDLHVHTAVLHCKADALITQNVQDFGDPADLAYELYTPDDFLCLADDSSPLTMRSVTKKQNNYWQNRPDSKKKSLTEALHGADCPDFAVRVNQHLRVLSGVRKSFERSR